jgi:hypothetical protein
VVLLALAVPAAAAPVTLGRAVTDAGTTVHGQYGSVRPMTIQSQRFGTQRNLSVGAFDVRVTVPTSGTIPGLGNRFAAWCLDIGRNLSLPSQYDVTSTPFGAPGPDRLTEAQQDAITALFNIARANVLDFSTNAASAGFQLALWEVVNETAATFSVSNDTTGGTFRVTGGGNGAVGVANGLLGQLVGYTSPVHPRFRVVYLQSQDTRPTDGYNRDSQNLVAFAPVPVPAAGALLLAALAGLGLARRRQVRNS